MEKELAVESDLKNLPVIGEFIDEVMQCFGVDDAKDVYAVQLSVDEACTNIIKHAYANKQEGKIVVRCLISETSKFVVQIMDWGDAFDPTALPTPDTHGALNERKEGGLGVFFMKKFMDEVTYRRSDNMNLLILAKHIKK
jgi:serine/threonine-protein kinase RsbW